MVASVLPSISKTPHAPRRGKALGIAAAVAVADGDVESTTSSRVFGQDYMERVALSRAGVPAAAVDVLAGRLGLSRARFVAALGLKGSTIERRLAAKQALSPAESDKLYRVEKVLSRAVEVLEDEGGAVAWLQRPIRSLGGVSPLSLLDTDAGVDLVMDTLARIEYGIVA